MFQVTPRWTTALPSPKRSKISSVRRAWQTPREPMLTVLSSSSSSTGWPRWARSMASARPTGPAPTTTSGTRRTAGAPSSGARRAA